MYKMDSKTDGFTSAAFMQGSNYEVRIYLLQERPEGEEVYPFIYKYS